MIGDLRRRVTEALGGLERVVASIPGYKGYKDKELRREADRLLREHIARQLDEGRRKLTELQIQLLNSGHLRLTDDLERATMKLQILLDKLKTARYGYSGFFDAVKVKEEELDALYAFDETLLKEAAKAGEAITKLAQAIKANEGIEQAIAELTAVAQGLLDTFAKREEAILAIKGEQ